MAEKCKECGCVCKQCTVHKEKLNDMHLHVEIENLRQRLVEKDNHIVTMETHFLNEADKFPNGELASMKEELLSWQDKYSRLYEAHKRLQKVNQNLEDKLLKIVDKCETEKGAFTKDIATLSHKLAEANHTIYQLTKDNEKYRSDVNLAIQLLQCKPSNFVGQKYESLPTEVQAKVKSYVALKTRNSEMLTAEIKSITVPISTFPPTAMVYNVTKPVVGKPQDTVMECEPKVLADTVPVAIVAKVLEERGKERIYTQHCNTCTCHRHILKIDSETQTEAERNKVNVSLGKPDVMDLTSKRETNSSSGRNYSQLKDSKTNQSVGNCVNMLIEAKEDPFRDNTSQRVANNYANVKSKSKRLNLENEEEEEEEEGEEEASTETNRSAKLSKDMKNLDDQYKIDVINERLWKNNWMNAKKAMNVSENELHLDVINERVWRSSSSSNSSSNDNFERPLRPALGKGNSTENLLNRPERAGPSDSDCGAAPGPTSSSAGRVRQSSGSGASSGSSSRADRPAGPRNCLMRLTPGSKSVLLDNVDAYETVMYTSSGSSKPGTALVHLAKSTRSASVSSEETTRSECDLSSDDSHRIGSSDHFHSKDYSIIDMHSAGEILGSSVLQCQSDLMTFDASSEDEHRQAALAYAFRSSAAQERDPRSSRLPAAGSDALQSLDPRKRSQAFSQAKL